MEGGGGCGEDLDRALVLNRISVDIQSRCKRHEPFLLSISFLALHMSKKELMHRIVGRLFFPPFFLFILRSLSKMKVAQTSCITSNSLYDNDVSKQETV